MILKHAQIRDCIEVEIINSVWINLSLSRGSYFEVDLNELIRILYAILFPPAEKNLTFFGEINRSDIVVLWGKSISFGISYRMPS